MSPGPRVGFSITSGATRAARCARESAERGSPSSSFRRVGTVEGTEVTCPWHGAKFDIRAGAVLGPPATQAVKSYPVRITGANIEIEV